MRNTLAWVLLLSMLVPTGASAFSPGDRDPLVLVQVPYRAPPESDEVPDNAVPPNTDPLDAKEIKRAEALLPLLAGEQELWAMGEFVHLGAPVVPVLVKALKMADPRLRYNAIETMNIIKEPSAAAALVEKAMEPNEMVRVREHALRVAVRLDPSATIEAIRAMGKDPHETIRKTVAFEGRYVRDKAVIPVLIELMKDEERFVAITAVQSLWRLTRHETAMHDWASSTQDERVQWAQEWVDWWAANKDTFEIPEPRAQRRGS